jgi:hypothetical protein
VASANVDNPKTVVRRNFFKTSPQVLIHETLSDEIVLVKVVYGLKSTTLRSCCRTNSAGNPDEGCFTQAWCCCGFDGWFRDTPVEPERPGANEIRSTRGQGRFRIAT